MDYEDKQALIFALGLRYTQKQLSLQQKEQLERLGRDIDSQMWDDMMAANAKWGRTITVKCKWLGT